MKVDLITVGVFFGVAWFLLRRQEAQAAADATTPAEDAIAALEDGLAEIVSPEALEAAEDFIGDFANGDALDALGELGI